jgi:hypothetical protein
MHCHCKWWHWRGRSLWTLAVVRAANGAIGSDSPGYQASTDRRPHHGGGTNTPFRDRPIDSSDAVFSVCGTDTDNQPDHRAASRGQHGEIGHLSTRNEKAVDDRSWAQGSRTITASIIQSREENI